MHGKLMLASFMAGGVIGGVAAVMAMPGYRQVMMRKAKAKGRKLMRAARQLM